MKRKDPWAQLTRLEIGLAIMFMPGLWVFVGLLSKIMPFPLAGLIFAVPFFYIAWKNDNWK